MADGGSKRLRGGRSLHPRVDPVAIVLVASADGTRCLLGRQARYPAGMYTCVSGFVEHAESVESGNCACAIGSTRPMKRRRFTESTRCVGGGKARPPSLAPNRRQTAGAIKGFHC